MIRLKRKVWRMVLICSVSVILWSGRQWIGSTSESELQQHVEDHQFESNVAVQKEVAVAGSFIEEKDYRKYFKYTDFTKMKFGPIYILGTTLGNTTDYAHWDIVKVYAEVDEMYPKKTNISCCLKYLDFRGPDFTKVPTIFAGRPNSKTRLSAYHYTCLNPKPGVVPDGVALTVSQFTCSEEDVTYRKPDTPLRESEIKLGLCLKVAFGNRSAELIIEFIEAHRYLGVDKFICYILDCLNEELNADAQKVLAYYASIGIMDAYMYEPAAWRELKRTYHPASKQSNSDRQLVTFDSFEKMSGYTYFGVLDFDEFLIPSKDRSLKELLADLYHEHTNASGFTFMSKAYHTNWPSSNIVNDLIIGKHTSIDGQPPSYFTRKNLYKPKYMHAGEISNHYPKPANPDNPMVKLDSEPAYIRHYRKCFNHYCKTFNITSLLSDTWVAEWSRRIQERVYSVRYRVFGNSSYIS